MIIHKFRFAVYSYLNSNRKEFNNYNFEYDGKIITSDKYIDIIKNNKELTGELEIYIINKILVFIKKNDIELEIINKEKILWAQKEYY